LVVPGCGRRAVASRVATVAFAFVESRQPDPLIRTKLLRLPSLRAGSMLTLLLGVWNGGEMLVLSIYFQQVLHDSPLIAGLAMAPKEWLGSLLVRSALGWHPGSGCRGC
jgi:hypothetical protein